LLEQTSFVDYPPLFLFRDYWLVGRFLRAPRALACHDDETGTTSGAVCLEWLAERKQGTRDLLAMSDSDDHQQLLQILEVHGQQFLNSFALSSEPSSNKRELEESDDSSVSGEEDEEWHGFGAGNVGSYDSEDGGSIDSFHGALHLLCLIAKVFMSEEDSEEESSDEDTSPVGGPSVITFQDPSKKSEASASDRTLKKAFMVRDFSDLHLPGSITPTFSHRKFPSCGKKLRIQQTKQNPVRTTP